MKYYFLADTHFGHSAIIKYCNRPFMDASEKGIYDLIQKGIVPQKELKISKESTEKMDAAIIQSINNVVAHKDTLILLGDFCLSSEYEIVKKYRDRINCQNIFLILGNHDNREVCEKIFPQCFENYLFKIDGKIIFTSHYPTRSWNKAYNGSWMLYGHVHGKLNNEDNGLLLEYDRKIIQSGFSSVLIRHGIDNQNIINDLLAVCDSTKGIDLTLDVGVDNLRCELPFATPWSIKDIELYMAKKASKWNARKSCFKNNC
jgi:calcineurin-like phosphoesterase family protein